MPAVLDPIERFVAAFAHAQAHEPFDASAAALATADASGRVAARMVLLRGVDARGFVFYTNRESRKGRDLAANPRAALCLHWPQAKEQVRIEGDVVPVDDAESDAYFESRPRGHRIGAWASRQSSVLPDRAALEAEAAAAEARFAEGPIPRPPYWGGYRIVPDRIEFWREGAGRLHHRDAYRRTPDGWTAELLSP